MYFNIIRADYIDGYRIELTFSNNRKGIIDFENYIKEGEIFQDIRDIDKFRNYKVDYGTVIWENGEVDIAPETLYMKATGDDIIFDDPGAQKAG